MAILSCNGRRNSRGAGKKPRRFGPPPPASLRPSGCDPVRPWWPPAQQPPLLQHSTREKRRPAFPSPRHPPWGPAWPPPRTPQLVHWHRAPKKRKHRGPKMQLPCPPPQLKRWVPGPCQRPRGRWRPAPVLGGSPPRPRRRLHLRRACLSLSGADSNNPPQSHCPQCIPARSLARGPRCAYPSTGMRVPKHTPCKKKHPHPPPPSCPKCQNVRIACITRHPVAHAIPRLFKHFRFRKAWPHPRHLATRQHYCGTLPQWSPNFCLLKTLSGRW